MGGGFGHTVACKTGCGYCLKFGFKDRRKRGAADEQRLKRRKPFRVFQKLYHLVGHHGGEPKEVFPGLGKEGEIIGWFCGAQIKPAQKRPDHHKFPLRYTLRAGTAGCAARVSV